VQRKKSTKPFEQNAEISYSFENKRTHDMNGQGTDLIWIFYCAIL